MSHSVPTVKVKTDSEDNEDGYFLINEADFDPEVHDLFEEPSNSTTPPSTSDSKKNQGKK